MCLSLTNNTSGVQRTSEIPEVKYEYSISFWWLQVGFAISKPSLLSKKSYNIPYT